MPRTHCDLPPSSRMPSLNSDQGVTLTLAIMMFDINDDNGKKDGNDRLVDKDLTCSHIRAASWFESAKHVLSSAAN